LIRRFSKIVEVRYYDHTISLGGPELPKPTKRKAVGYLVKESDDYLVVASDLPIDGVQGSRAIAIRKPDIISIEILREEDVDVKPLSYYF
jgi:hypothetical protein